MGFFSAFSPLLQKSLKNAKIAREYLQELPAVCDRCKTCAGSVPGTHEGKGKRRKES
jgi:hypothetical protein